MEEKYFVARAYRYKESGKWEYSLVGMYDTLSAAKQAYHDHMGRIIKATNDMAMVIIFNSFGDRIDSDFDTTYVEPEPNEEGAE